MLNEKKDPGGVQIDIRSPSPVPSVTALSMHSMNLNLPTALTLEEKKYLLAVERGDTANVRRMLQKAHRKKHFNINCVDSLGRGALTLAIDGENLEMVELLVVMNVDTKDGLLLAINAEFVEAVELLLEHEELIHRDGEPYSWQKVDIGTATFMPDITPLMLAAHKNNYEILKILLDRGATLPMPHDVKCGCDDCIRRSSEDSLRFSLARVHEYRALASPSLISLSSQDPLLTAFQLSWELRNLAFAEQESKNDYLELRRQCQAFAVDLLHQSRSSQELAIILNYDPDAPPYQDGDHMKLARLELAIDYKQKKFVAHPNIQQLLASLWYEGVPGFRRKTALQKVATISKVAFLFPFYCMMYMIFPTCETAKFMRKPFMKFLIHASSYLFFLLLLILVSQRAEVQAVMFFGTEKMKSALLEDLQRQRGRGPTFLELTVVLYVLGFIWEETEEIFNEGIQSYLRNLWNFIDFSRNSLYVCVICLRIFAYIQQTNEINKNPETAYIPRENWNDFDPQLIAEGFFAAANVFSAFKLIHLFSINPHLGPLQISLGRMVIDIIKFFFIYTLVLFAFACGLNQLLWYFADLEKAKCYSLPGGLPDWENQGDACMKWRRFGNLFESSQSLFWASFGMIGLEAFELTGIKSYTRFWGLLMFGSYSVINVIVLLNLLIAMMSNSYAMIVEHSDTEWKFARTKLWMSYFEESSTLPPPFNIFPNMKHLLKPFRSKKKRGLFRESTIRRREGRERAERYTNVMRALVWRYVSAKHRLLEENPVTEDDINEVKMEISAMRYEMLEVFGKNGMDISGTERKEKTVLAKRMKVWERRLMKDFQVAPVDMPDQDECVEEDEDANPLARFRRVARQVAAQTTSAKWGQVMTGVGVELHSQIGRCKTRESFKQQQHLKKAMAEARRLVQKSPLFRSRSCSPIMDYETDATTSTLVELLKNITEELAEISPGNTLQVDNRKSRSTTPLTQLTAQLQTVLSKNPSPMPLKGNRSPGNISANRSPLLSSSHGKNSDSRCSTSPSPEMPKNDEKSTYLNIKSPTPTIASPPPKSPPNSPPPIIITSEIQKKAPQSENVKAKEDPDPLVSGITSPPKVVKRKAPAPVEEIAVARPVASKSVTSQGMLPPPPSKVADQPILIPLLSTTPATPLTTQKFGGQIIKPTVSVTAPTPMPSPVEKHKGEVASAISKFESEAKPSSVEPMKSKVEAPRAISVDLPKSKVEIDKSKVEKEKPKIESSKPKIEEKPKIEVPKPKIEVPKPITEEKPKIEASKQKLEEKPKIEAPKPKIELPKLPVASSMECNMNTSTEKLIPAKENPSTDAHMASSSPPCLRPINKIEDVRTIKRQPKSGWL